jgi:hypothetical protein
LRFPPFRFLPRGLRVGEPFGEFGLFSRDQIR